MYHLLWREQEIWISGGCAAEDTDLIGFDSSSLGRVSFEVSEDPPPLLGLIDPFETSVRSNTQYFVAEDFHMHFKNSSFSQYSSIKHYLKPTNRLFYVMDSWHVFCDVGTSWTINVVWTRLALWRLTTHIGVVPHS